MLPSQ
jgi:4-hydroxy-3-polyprenylbenzoate decarboxylase